MNGTMILLLAMAGFLLITNTVCFCLMYKDKKAAREGRWRVKEKTLFISCALFGALGGVLGMKLLRHKTKHTHFRVFFPIFLVLQTALVLYALYLVLGLGREVF